MQQPQWSRTQLQRSVWLLCPWHLMLLLTYWSNKPSSTLFCLFTVEVTVRGKVGSPISIIKKTLTASTWLSSDEGGWMLCLHRVKHDDEPETLSVLNSSVLLVCCISAFDWSMQRSMDVFTLTHRFLTLLKYVFACRLTVIPAWWWTWQTWRGVSK